MNFLKEYDNIMVSSKNIIERSSICSKSLICSTD
nr:MAG TPA: hypothetical protein [Caudoviricetes sp.]DAI74876.1 MAG TPA: hypothetical protein [Caudoviricetes sp.]